MKKICTLLSLVLVAMPISFVTAYSTTSDKLYVAVTEEGNSAKVLTNAKVSLNGVLSSGDAYDKWGELSTESGQAVFSGVDNNQKYHISAKAAGYLPAQKDFTKESGGTDQVSIALTKAPAGSVGSVRVAVLTVGPQGSTPSLTTATFEIFRAGKLMASGDMKNTNGKEGVVLSKLPTGEDYEARVTAPGYQSQTAQFVIETNTETWLPFSMQQSIANVPTTSTLEEQINGLRSKLIVLMYELIASLQAQLKAGR